MAKLLSKRELAEAFDTSLPTIDAWVRKGCPYEQKGGKGNAWKFSLPKVIAWRERYRSTLPHNGRHIRHNNAHEPMPENVRAMLERRPDFENFLRMIAEEAVR